MCCSFGVDAQSQLAWAEKTASLYPLHVWALTVESQTVTTGWRIRKRH